jgi:copper chaperone CopZ
VKRFSSLAVFFALTLGCGQQMAPPSGSAKATPVAFNVGGAPTVELSVPGMMCEESCVPKVRETLAAQPGVKDVKVDFATKTATVAVDKAKFDGEAAVATLLDFGFENTKLVGQPDASPTPSATSAEAQKDSARNTSG